MPMLRGHNCFGPGNPITNGPPQDTDDVYAKEHDEAYAEAQRLGDPSLVRTTDLQFISRTFQEGKKHPHAWLGTIGIGGKYLFETVFGVQYPRIKSILKHTPVKERVPVLRKLLKAHTKSKPLKIELGKRKSVLFDSTEAKIMKRNDEEMEVVNEAGYSTTGAMQVNQIIKNPTMHSQTYRFKNVFQVYTGGYRFEYEPIQTIMATLNIKATSHDYFLKTPSACLNPNYLFNYISNAQFLDLPERTFVKSCDFKVTPLGYRLPFATNQTNTGCANSQLVVQIATAVGLDAKFNCFAIPHKWNSADETKPVVEDASDIGGKLNKMLW